MRHTRAASTTVPTALDAQAKATTRVRSESLAARSSKSSSVSGPSSMCLTTRSRSAASSSHGATPPSWSAEETRISSPGSNARPAVRLNVKSSEVMLAPKVISWGSQPRKRAAWASAVSRISLTRKLVAYPAPRLALASRSARAMASPTSSGTWDPPGASRNANPPPSAEKRRRTSPMLIVGLSVSATALSLLAAVTGNGLIAIQNQTRGGVVHLERSCKPPRGGQLAGNRARRRAGGSRSAAARLRASSRCATAWRTRRAAPTPRS